MPKRDRSCNDFNELHQYIKDIEYIKHLLQLNKQSNNKLHIIITPDYINYLQQIINDEYMQHLNNYKKKVLILKNYKLQLDYFINIIYRQIVSHYELKNFIKLSRNEKISIFTTINNYDHNFIVIINKETTYQLIDFAKFILNNICINHLDIIININFNNDIFNTFDHSFQSRGNNCSCCKGYFDYIIVGSKIRKLSCQCCNLIKNIKIIISDLLDKLEKSNNLKNKLIISILNKITEIKNFIETKIKIYDKIQTVHLLKLKKDYNINILHTYINSLNDIIKNLTNLNNDYSKLEELLYS